MGKAQGGRPDGGSGKLAPGHCYESEKILNLSGCGRIENILAPENDGHV